MKRPIYYLVNTILSLSLILLVISCGDDEPAIEHYSISGNVTYSDMSGASAGADGAVIYLAASDVATTTYTMTTVADENGAFSFSNLEAGNYFLFSNFNNMNSNNGRIIGVNFDSGEGVVVTITDANVTQDIALTSIDQSIDFAVDTEGSWNQDYSHSNIDFSFPYDEYNADYTGRFDDFTIDVKFDKDNLASASINASIDLLSVNTSSRGGRDSFWDDALQMWDYGCIAGTFGVVVDETTLLPDESTRYATFVSDDIIAYGDGFLASGDFTFNGNTSTEELFFRFINGFEGTSRSGVATRYSSFEGQLKFDALDDYKIESNHVGGETITVDISFQVTLPLE